MIRHLRAYRRLAPVPVLAWLLIQLAMTGLFASAATAVVPALSDDRPGAYSIVICTPEGLQYVTVDENGQIQSDEGTESWSCEHCKTLAKSRMPMAPGTVLHLMKPDAVLLAAIKTDEPAAGQIAAAAGPTRAPPR